MKGIFFCLLLCSRGFVERSLYGGVEPERGGSYNAVSYQDLSSDCFPELVLQRSKGKERWLEVWTRDNVSRMCENPVYICT